MWPSTGVKGDPETAYSYNGERGYHCDSYLKLNNRNFSSKLTCDSFAVLNNVTAPELRSDSYCKLTSCNIAKVVADSFVDVTNSHINTIKSDSYVTLTNVEGLKSLICDGFVKASNCSIESIKADSYVHLVQVKNIQSVISDNYISASNCNIFSIKSDSYVTLNNVKDVDRLVSQNFVNITDSNLRYINADSYAKLNNTTASELHCDSLDANNSKIVSIKTLESANFHTCQVIEKVDASDIIAIDCSLLGSLVAKSTLSLTKCENIASISAPSANIKGCRIIGNVDSNDVKIINSVVEGCMTVADYELKLQNSHIKKLVLKKSVPVALARNIVGGQDVGPAHIAPLVRYMQQGMLNIYPKDRGGYRFVGNPNSRIGGASFQMNNIEFMSYGKGSGVSMKSINGKATIRVGNIEIPMECTTNKNIQEALNFIEAQKNPPQIIEDEIIDQKPKPQTVIIIGGHVEELVFLEAGGVVQLENGATVGNIVNGQHCEEKQLIEAVAPDEFNDPIHFDVMLNPYITPSGRVYDYKTLVMLAHKETKMIVCPLTRKEYKLDECKSDDALKNTIQEWLKTHRPI